jgi:hypothetical protein
VGGCSIAVKATETSNFVAPGHATTTREASGWKRQCAMERQQIRGVNGSNPTVAPAWRRQLIRLPNALASSTEAAIMREFAVGPRQGERYAQIYRLSRRHRRSIPPARPSPRANRLRRQTRRSVHVELRSALEPGQRKQGPG